MTDKIREICYSSNVVKSVLDADAIEELVEILSVRTAGYNPSVALIELYARILKEVRNWDDWNRPMPYEEKIDRSRDFSRFGTLIFPNGELIDSFLDANQQVQHHLYNLVVSESSGRDIAVYAGCLQRSGIVIGAVKDKDETNWVRDCLRFYEILKSAVKDDPKAGTFDLTSPNDFIMEGFASRTLERESWVYQNIRSYARTVILLRLVYGDVVIREFLMKFRDYNTQLDSTLILNTLDRWGELRDFPSDWIVNMTREVL